MFVSKLLPGTDQLEKNNFLLLLLHLFLGIIVYYFQSFSVAYGLSLFAAGLLYIILSKDKNWQVLQAVAYFSGAEIFLRMTRGNLLYEYGRYGILIFFLVGIFYSHFHRKAKWLWLSLLLLIPGIIISLNSLVPVQKAQFVFVFIGPLVTIIGAVYCFQKELTFVRLQELLFLFLLPVISCVSFLVLDYPAASMIFYNMESNFLFTGNFGPNQMATILGLCVFILLSKLLVQKMHVFYSTVYFVLMAYVFYRCMLTFSRGGMISSIIICTVFIYQIFRSRFYADEIRRKLKIVIGLVAMAIVILAVQSDGFIIKRYAVLVGLSDKNDDSKMDRQHLMSYELKLFKSAPVFGVGAGKGIQNSQSYFGESVSSHNEITRLLAEHGLLGLGSFLVLLIFPILVNYKNDQNIFFWSFYLFWLLTIAHSGLRLAAPSFIYALTLLNVHTNSSQPTSSEA